MIVFLKDTHQFFIPIYQRTYSWTEKHCEQLWDDIVHAATESDAPSHFIGSIVYINEDLHRPSIIPELRVIDGQQRLTTLALLFAALTRTMKDKDCGEIDSKSMRDYFLFNSNAKGAKRHKLILTRDDRDTLSAIIENRPIPEEYSKNLVNNFEYFQSKLTKSGLDPCTIWRGISKLVMVYISLDPTNDRPQVIFESLNSTGLNLSKTDLIRNYILMGMDRDRQEQIYTVFWRPIEEKFKKDPRKFDYFVKDYLTIKNGQIPLIRDIYPAFKEYADRQDVEDLVGDIHYLAKFYTRLAFEEEQDAELNQIIHNINALETSTPYPFLIKIYADYDEGRISRADILEIFAMVDSYLLRRAICDVPTNSLGKTFASLAVRIDKDHRVESLKAAFQLMDTYRRFPKDAEFESRLISKDIYNTAHIRKHLLERLENHGKKEKTMVDECTIEHILPQNPNLSKEWRDMLGLSWRTIREKYLHTLGNLTLTGCNSDMGDSPFREKRDMPCGFANSPIRLNEGLRNLEKWSKSEIIARGKTLAEKAVEMWRYPHLPQDVLKKYAKMDEDNDPEGDDPEDDESTTPQWETQRAQASVQVLHAVDTLISQIHQKFDCVDEPRSWWLAFYVRKPTERKTMFALLDCGRTVANVAFRIDPDTFEAGANTRKVAGWFFPAGTERRASLTADTLPEIMDNLEHAYNATLRALDMRHDVGS